MAKTILDPASRQQLLARFGKLTAQTTRKWGSMTASQMVKHCAEPLRGLLGEIDVPPGDAPAFLHMFPMKQLIIYVLPIPKNVSTALAYIVRNEPDFTASRKELAAVLERIAARGVAEDYKPHPAFGKLSGKDVGVLTYKHLDHHLRQFGL